MQHDSHLAEHLFYQPLYLNLYIDSQFRIQSAVKTLEVNYEGKLRVPYPI